MKMFVEAWNAKYDADKYPIDYYFYYLDEIQKATTPAQLGESIIALLYWKDGKVVKDSKGNVAVGEERYLLFPTKPNTYDESKHKRTLISLSFYQWAKEVMAQNSFDASKIGDLARRFHLYGGNAVVIPAFILHTLSPRIYPLYDQHVERAKRVLLAQDAHFTPRDITIFSYQEYQQLFTGIVEEGHLNQYRVEIKQLDNALWSFGKCMKPKTGKDQGIKKRLVPSSSHPGLTEEIREYARSILHKSKEDGKEYMDLRSGDLHKQMNLQNRMPAVCNAMVSLGVFRPEIIHDTPSGKSSTKVVRYYFKD
ncbi:hypothetical protein [Mesobacillus maritimus]|uniref:hypothetical protein n=1 Tax=Mesobacillus maritimus TaxID=1643336 RepID=UPI00384FCF6B